MGRDAADISPKMIPDEQLLARDNSGGIDFTPYTMEWDDGGRVTGPKSYLSAGGAGKGTGGDERKKEKRIGRNDKDD
jgi:hypothetical protein